MGISQIFGVVFAVVGWILTGGVVLSVAFLISARPKGGWRKFYSRCLVCEAQDEVGYHAERDHQVAEPRHRGEKVVVRSRRHRECEVCDAWEGKNISPLAWQQHFQAVQRG